MQRKSNTHIFYAMTFLFFVNLAVYEVMWQTSVERGRPQLTMRRMRIACWIPEAVNTHSEYVTITAFSPQQWLHERASMSRCTYITFLVKTLKLLVLHVTLLTYYLLTYYLLSYYLLTYSMVQNPS